MDGAPAPVTQVAGDVLTLARAFGEHLEALAGSFEIAIDASDLTSRAVAIIDAWAEREYEDRTASSKRRTPPTVLSWAEDRLGVPELSSRLRAAGIESLVPDDLHDVATRDRAAAAIAGITGVDAAFAATGSVVLSSGPGMNRVASLLPLRHLLLVPLDRIYPSIEAWIEELRRSDRLGGFIRENRQISFITGPSKSADIELNLTLGVHGPRVVHAILFDASS